MGFVYELHKQMFSQVWKWAGRARQSGKNIGIDWHQIASHTALLLADTKYWIDHKTSPLDEIAARFHHRLVKIHIFPNGSGRHARLVTDLLLELCGQERFSWGEKTTRTPLETESERRRDYIIALQARQKRLWATPGFRKDLNVTVIKIFLPLSVRLSLPRCR